MSKIECSGTVIPIRPLRTEEKELLLSVIQHLANSLDLLSEIDEVLVEDLSDGGMGSVRVIRDNSYLKRKAMPYAQAMYIDEDSVLISVQINSDSFGRLYEIDIWKTDFSSVKRYPNENSRQASA